MLSLPLSPKIMRFPTKSMDIYELDTLFEVEIQELVVKVWILDCIPCN